MLLASSPFVSSSNDWPIPTTSPVDSLLHLEMRDARWLHRLCPLPRLAQHSSYPAICRVSHALPALLCSSTPDPRGWHTAQQLGRDTSNIISGSDKSRPQATLANLPSHTRQCAAKTSHAHHSVIAEQTLISIHKRGRINRATKSAGTKLLCTPAAQPPTLLHYHCEG